ncbi:YjfB family protein [Noviherbaspirillum sp. L7-7A]|uniref:YjfB family protein n=1 Tax=Noviherbaspirillum sp. L7-7A TaxID=2850560 RepID=UPI00201339C0|nr:YjfB family protein [Noviherbaspirillum sp. L7-7A]
MSTALTTAKTSEEVGTTVLKKALDLSASTASALIAAAAPAPTPVARQPAHVGQNIDTTA